jgi:hypothetical protein
MEKKMGIVNWRQLAQDSEGWRRANGEALVLLG